MQGLAPAQRPKRNRMQGNIPRLSFEGIENFMLSIKAPRLHPGAGQTTMGGCLRAISPPSTTSEAEWRNEKLC